MICKNLGGGYFRHPGQATPTDANCSPWSDGAASTTIPDAFRALRLLDGHRGVARAVFACNAYVDAQAPWALRKTDPERMAAVLGTLVAAVRELHAGNRAGRSQARADKSHEP